MFRVSHSPQRQPLLDEQPQALSPSPPPRMSTATSFRSFFFGNEDAHHDQHHEDADHAHGPASVGKPTKMPSHAPMRIPSNAVVSPTPPTPGQTDPRNQFQRANSHPLRLDASAALSATRAFDPSMSRAAALDAANFQSTYQRVTTPRQQLQNLRQSLTFGEAPELPSLRTTVYGSCSHVLSTVIRVLVHTIKTHHEYSDPSTAIAVDGPTPPLDNDTVRKTKLLYIALLERAQKERGEWQGFSADEITKKNGDTEEAADDGTTHPDESAHGLLTAHLRDMTKDEAFVILHELLELSFRNLRVSVVAPSVYATHRTHLAAQSLVCPVSLESLVRIGGFVSDLSRDEKRCVLHLLNFWCAACVVNADTVELRRLVENRQMLVLSESSESEFMQPVARRSTWADPVALDLLTVMAHYRELIFSDLEFYRIRQEMEIAPKVPAPALESLPDASKANPRLSESEANESDSEALHNGVVSTAVEADEPMAEQTVDDQDNEWTIALGELDASDTVETAPSSASSTSQLVSPDDNTNCASVVEADPLPCPPPLASPPAKHRESSKRNQRRRASSPSADDTTTKMKSPRTPICISPRIHKARHYHIHAAPPSVSKRPASMSFDPHDKTMLPLVAVALASASLGMLATVAFFAVRKSSQ